MHSTKRSSSTYGVSHTLRVHSQALMGTLQRARFREMPGRALAAASESTVVKPFCRIRHDSRFARFLQRSSVHHGIVQTGRMLQCPS